MTIDSAADGAEATILIVDDDPLIIVAASKALHGLGKIIFAINGKNALQLAAEQKPDVILLDAEMPDMNGFEVCASLKANSVTSSIPIIFVTSRSEEGFEEQVFDQGAADYINKPINPKVMVARTSLQLNYVNALKRLERLSLTDELSGLNNRRSFDETLRMEFSRAKRGERPISLLMIDIDEFKKYNDHFGHIAGDECIQQIAKILFDSAGRPTDFVARYGGEEFAIILPDTDLKGAKHFANVILERIVDNNILHAPKANSSKVTVSIGYFSLIPAIADESLQLLKIADDALFEAKTRGRGCAHSPILPKN